MDNQRFLLNPDDDSDYILTTYSHEPNLFDRNSQDLSFYLEPYEYQSRLIQSDLINSLYSKIPLYKYVVVPKIDTGDFLHRHYMYSTVNPYTGLLEEVLSLGYNNILVQNPYLHSPRHLAVPIWRLNDTVVEGKDYIINKYELSNLRFANLPNKQ